METIVSVVPRQHNAFSGAMGGFCQNGHQRVWLTWLRNKFNDLTPNVLLVITTAASFVGRDLSCFPSISTLGDLTGLSQKAVRTALQECQRRGLLNVVPRYRADGCGQTSNLYVFLDNPWASQGIEAERASTIVGVEDTTSPNQLDIPLEQARGQEVVEPKQRQPIHTSTAPIVPAKAVEICTLPAPESRSEPIGTQPPPPPGDTPPLPLETPPPSPGRQGVKQDLLKEDQERKTASTRVHVHAREGQDRPKRLPCIAADFSDSIPELFREPIKQRYGLQEYISLSQVLGRTVYQQCPDVVAKALGRLMDETTVLRNPTGYFVRTLQSELRLRAALQNAPPEDREREEKRKHNAELAARQRALHDAILRHTGTPRADALRAELEAVAAQRRTLLGHRIVQTEPPILPVVQDLAEVTQTAEQILQNLIDEECKRAALKAEKKPTRHRMGQRIKLESGAPTARQVPKDEATNCPSANQSAAA